LTACGENATKTLINCQKIVEHNLTLIEEDPKKQIEIAKIRLKELKSIIDHRQGDKQKQITHAENMETKTGEEVEE